jgi:hypothetical protein
MNHPSAMQANFLVQSLRVALSSMIALWIGSVAHAEAFKAGAYDDELGSGSAVCVTQKNLDAFAVNVWQKAMQQRQRDCKIIETEQDPMPDSVRWKAVCAERSDPKLTYQYKVSASSFSNKLVIDSAIVDETTGELKLKRALLGSFKGACGADARPLDPWSYLDIPVRVVATAVEKKAAERVAIQLIRCANIMNATAQLLVAGKKAEMLTLGQALLVTANEMLGGDLKRYESELTKSANDVAGEFIGKSNQQRIELVQSCSKYLTPDGIEQAVKAEALK